MKTRPRHPAQMRQMRLDRVREQLEVTSDDDWKVIGDLAGAVIDAETALNADRSRGGGFGGRGGRNRGGNPDPNAPQQPQNNGGNRGGRFGTPSPELEALQKAIDDKAGPDEIKALLAKFQASHKSKLGKLATAEENLRKVLSVRQEGQAVLAGLMN